MPDNNSTPSPDYLKLQAILDNAVDAIITIDVHGNIESVNPATTTLFQYSADEMLGHNVNMLMDSPYREEHDTYIDNYVRSNVPKIIGIGREVLGRRKDGATFSMHLAVSEISTGGHRSFTGVIRDVSDLKAAERKLGELNDALEESVRLRTEELREAQAELVANEKLVILGQVSGGIAHEIRNPLNAVKASAYYLLNAKNATTEKKEEHLHRIDHQVTLIDNVITALSDVAKLPEPMMSTHSAREMLERVVRQVSPPSEISVDIEIPDNADLVMADMNQVPIVFRNLLRNACDAMPNGGAITITSEQRGNYIGITVHDTGVGIPDHELSRILAPMYSTKSRRMGLGLAICQTIVEKNGGRLHFESKLGEGSRFTVELNAPGNSR